MQNTHVAGAALLCSLPGMPELEGARPLSAQDPSPSRAVVCKLAVCGI